MEWPVSLKPLIVKGFSQKTSFPEDGRFPKSTLKPLSVKGFKPYCFPQSVDNFHQCPKGNDPIRPFFPDFPPQRWCMPGQIELIGLPTAAEILYGIGNPV